VLRILAVAGLTIEWDRCEAGGRVRAAPDGASAELIDSVTARRWPKAVTTPIGEGFTSVNVGLRKALDLYANLRPVWSIPGIPSRYSGIDLVIVRENTEDLYSGLEHEVVPGVVESLKIITARASTRIAEFAFAYARRHGRQKVTSIHEPTSEGGAARSCARPGTSSPAHGHPVRREDRRRDVTPGDAARSLRTCS
jgi:isocitrate dehydrogenase (NAD+)